MKAAAKGKRYFGNKRALAIPLFLYGSLLTGTTDHRLDKKMRRLLRRAHPAVIQARLYHIDWYPGAVASSDKTDRVYGRLITLKDPALLQQLDRYEDYFPDDPKGSEFLRVLTRAQDRRSRRTVRCWVYLYNRDLADKTPIPGGNYTKFRV